MLTHTAQILNLFLQNYKDEESVNFLKDETVKSKFANAKKLSDVNVDDYDAIFYVGGHGPVIDLAFDPVNVKLASQVDFLSAHPVMALADRKNVTSFIVQASLPRLFATDLRE